MTPSQSAAACILVTLLFITASSAWAPDRVHYIDQIGANFLFRGAEPVVNGQFVYDELVATLRTAAMKDMGITLPPSFLLIDFNLLSIEFSDISVEQNFFKKNATLGQFVHYATIGDLVSPDSVPTSIRNSLAKKLPSWQIDNLPKAMTTLQSLLSQTYSKPTVVYVHCEAGMDRTGEVSGSYYIRYKGWPFQRAIAYDDLCIENRYIAPFSSNALQWYCYYLQQAEKFNLDCSIPNPFPPANCTVH